MSKKRRHPIPPHTGWPAGMLQDDCKGLSRWLASKPDARKLVREAAEEILFGRAPLPAPRDRGWI